METRVAFMSIILENRDAAEKLNGLLHEYAGYTDLCGAAILASVGIANLFKKPEKGQIKYGDFAECVAIGFAVALDAPQDTIAALAGKIGALPGVRVKTAYSGVISKE